MTLKKLKCFHLGSLGAGASVEKQFSNPEDWHVKHILISDRSAQTLSDVQAFISINNEPLTDDYAPASIFGSDKLVAIDVDKDVKSGSTIYVKLTNSGTNTYDIDLCLELAE